MGIPKSTRRYTVEEYYDLEEKEVYKSEFHAGEFYAAAASEKLSVMESGDYIAGRAARADDAAFAEVLKSIPATPVKEAWDRMPD